MATTMVTVTVPDGVYEGQEFIIEYEGQQLAVCCPDGCGPGSDIDLEVPAAPGGGGNASGAAPSLVDVEIPAGCYPGTEFTVSFDGREFNIVVPDGLNPGEMLSVEVPSAEDGAHAKSPALPKSPAVLMSPPPRAAMPPPKPKPAKVNLQDIPAFRGAGGGEAPKRDKPSAAKYLAGLDIPTFKGPLKGVTENSINSHAKWNQSTALDLFDMVPDAGYGRSAGDFQVGQLVQVLRSNGKYTYGKVMDYDPSGDHYSVMTKAGPKYFVDFDDITPEVVWNPLGGFARQ